MAALADAGGDRDRVVATAAAHPELPEVWAALGELCESEARGLSDHLEAYAYYRIGYHRGLGRSSPERLERGRDTCAGRMPPTAAFCPAWTVSDGWPKR